MIMEEVKFKYKRGGDKAKKNKNNYRSEIL